MLQSVLDLAVSIVLLLNSVTVKDAFAVKNYWNNGINRMWSLELSTAPMGVSHFINLEHCDGNFGKVNCEI